MQNEYKNAMNKMSLSSEDRARILANVKHEYKRAQKTGGSDKVIPFRNRPWISSLRIGTVVAACFVAVASAMLIRDQFKKGYLGHGSDMPASPPAVSGSAVEVWQRLDSIEDIGKKTDCRTYRLNNVSKDYKVKKVEVANEQRHVRITYKSEKRKDKILFEYKEGANATDITDRFVDEKQIKTEKVDGSEVKMYGDKKVDGMTWEKESCTFGVKMSHARSTDSARKLVSGTISEMPQNIDHVWDSGEEEPETQTNPNAVGWDAEEEELTKAEQESVLNDIYESFGFRVTLREPAEKVMYKNVDGCESFAFTYGAAGVLEGRRVIGYASWEGCPEGVMDDYEEMDTVYTGGIEVTLYQKGKYDRLFVFSRKDVEITLLLDDYRESDMEGMLQMLLEVIHVTVEDEEGDEPQPTEKPQPTPPSVSGPGITGEESGDTQPEE